jgi:hypothetical protein
VCRHLDGSGKKKRAAATVRDGSCLAAQAELSAYMRLFGTSSIPVYYLVFVVSLNAFALCC